jgi:hypothetical protein
MNSNVTSHLAYCTNVHAGADLAQTRSNLERHAVSVKKLFSPRDPMGLGLWLSASAARALCREDRLAEWAAWLAEVGLVPFTFNGFPFGDFHQRTVKHQVYHPTWWQPERRDYTRDLIVLLDALLPPGQEGTISTLPLAWGQPRPTAAELAAAAAALRQITEDLARLEADTGRLISLCLESEPGCVLQRSEDVVHFFENHLLTGQDERPLRRHLRVCHDICHQVVMFEEQDEVLARYRAAGIAVGKVQVSSAVIVPLETEPSSDHDAALSQLAHFAEDRYLHQTMIRTQAGALVFHDDLPAALSALRSGAAPAEWRIHFHVPIYLEHFGHLKASRQAILDCLQALRDHGDAQHLEVETYAWEVLPAELRQPDLAEGIAAELTWLREACRNIQL